MRIVGVLAVLTLASACAATPAKTASPPLPPSVVTSSPTTTTTTTTTPTSVTPVVQSIELPADLAGKTAATVEQQLRSLGFTAFKYLDQAGKQVTLDPSWTVVSVDGAGLAHQPSTVIIMRVDKPAPRPAPKTSTKAPVKPAPTTQPKPVAPKPQAPKPVVEPPAAVYYKNCSAARAAGAAPVRRGQPGYGSHLDRDGDGVGCE